jgi:hypothetical protein
MIGDAKKRHDTVMINHDSVMQEENRIEEIRIEDNRIEDSTAPASPSQPSNNFQDDMFTTNPSPNSSPKESSQGDFEAFWAAYPRKRNKPQAIKNYNAKIKAGISHETIMSCLVNYKREIDKKKISSEYIKHPASFLTCYEDFVNGNAQCSGFNRSLPDDPTMEIINA